MRQISIAVVVLSLVMVAGVRAEWSSNSGFELALTNGWYVFDNRPPSEIDVSTDMARTGSQSLKFATTSAPPSAPDVPYDVVDSPHGDAQPGLIYTVDAYYYAPSALVDHERFGVGLFFWKLDANTNWLAASDPGGWTVVYGPESRTGFTEGLETVGAWTRIAHTHTAPADAELLQVAIQVMGQGSTLYFDDLSVVPEPSSARMLLAGVLGMLALRRARPRLARIVGTALAFQPAEDASGTATDAGTILSNAPADSIYRVPQPPSDAHLFWEE